MALVSYSDSEGSDTEEKPKSATKVASKPAQNQTGATFSFNKSNSRKIQVNLGSTYENMSAQDGDEKPPSKRAKIGSGGFGGFNSMLPAPKRDNEKKSVPNGIPRKVFSLKTGAEPGFNRESDEEMKQLFAERSSLPQSPRLSTSTRHNEDSSISKSDTPFTGNPIRFKPLSVARNTKKRKPPSGSSSKAAIPVEQEGPHSPTLPSTITAPLPRPPKVSLFSTGPINPSIESNYLTGGAGDEGESEKIIEETENEVNNPGEEPANPLPSISNQQQSLDAIAKDLNLSAADRRRLFGREGKDSVSAINIVNFNTDQEYAANEMLRASGQQVQHNPVRGIAPGKHSLKQLVNAATSQKDALEESFAAGKSNKREAGSKYGW